MLNIVSRCEKGARAQGTPGHYIQHHSKQRAHNPRQSVRRWPARTKVMARGILGQYIQPHTATGAPSQTFTIPYHTIQKIGRDAPTQAIWDWTYCVFLNINLRNLMRTKIKAKQSYWSGVRATPSLHWPVLTLVYTIVAC